MAEAKADRAIFIPSLLTVVLVAAFILYYRISGNLTMSLWIFIPLAVVVSLFGWFFTRHAQKEIKAQRRTKAKGDMVSHYITGRTKTLHVVVFYLFGIASMVLGLSMLGIFFFTHWIDDTFFGLIGGLFLTLGIAAIIGASAFARGKSWGWALMFIVLVIFLLFMLTYPLFIRP